MFKKKTLFVALALAGLNTFAADYFVVVPVKNRIAANSGISVGLAPTNLPVGWVGQGYTYDFNQNLQVTGDAGFSGAGVSWAVTGLPAGLALNPTTGILSGQPSAAGTASFSVSAGYKAKSGSQAYALTVSTPTAVGSLTAVSSANFGSVLVGSTATRQFSFTNTGAGAATGVYASVSGGGLSFVSNTCGTQAAPARVEANNGSCAVTLSYAPTTGSAMSGSLSVVSSATNSPNTVALSGQGLQAIASTSVSNLNFSATVGSTSASQAVTLNNTGNAPMSVSAAALSGANPGSYSTSTTCGALLASAASCSYSVAFAPSSLGSSSATLSIPTGAGTQTVVLTGTGAAIVPTLGSFSVAATTTTSGTSTIVAPTSNSGGSFTYTSSDPSVATVSGNTITPVGVGSTTITATQAASGNYAETSTTATLSVTAGLPAGYVQVGALTWAMPTASKVGTYASCNTYVSTTSFNGTTGWRQPTKAEVQALIAAYPASTLRAKGWPATTYSWTWTTTLYSTGQYYVWATDATSQSIGAPLGFSFTGSGNSAILCAAVK